MRFLLDPTQQDSFKGTHFKFLGRYIHVDLKEKEVCKRIQADLAKDVAKVDETLLTGFMKLWLYQFYILAHLSWHFLIYDLNLTFAKTLGRSILPKLKSWSGVGRTADPGLLFRTKANFGLGLTAVPDHYQRMQIVKCQLLQNSQDDSIRAIFRARTAREAKFSRVWTATQLNTTAMAETELKLRYPANPGRQGLGFGNSSATFDCRQKRKIISQTALSFAQEKRIPHAHSLERQSAWLQWSELAEPFDFSWNNLIYGPGQYLIKFVLNSSINWVKTPDLLKLWGYMDHARCPLCSKEPCSLHHILVNCEVSLRTGRYNWRHDSVLSQLQPVLQDRIDAHNASPRDLRIRHISRDFVLPGTGGEKKSRSLTRIPPSLLDGASDWKLLVDYDSAPIVFPPHIFSTPQRPDIIIYSDTLKKVLLIELTCPAEEGIAAANVRKITRYTPLQTSINSGGHGWTAILITIEVGARGFVARSTFRCLARLGVSPRPKAQLAKTLSLVAAKTSYAIYLASTTKTWEPGPLLAPPMVS